MSTPLHASDLTGKLSLAQLQKLDWYQSSYQKTNFDKTRPEFTSLKNVMSQFNVKIYLGTWCGDTHEQVPQFIRMMSDAAVNTQKFEIIGLDRKKSHIGFKNTDQIQKLPTIVFYKDAHEVGRITETPEVSLLDDTAKIIQKAIR